MADNNEENNRVPGGENEVVPPAADPATAGGAPAEAANEPPAPPPPPPPEPRPTTSVESDTSWWNTGKIIAIVATVVVALGLAAIIAFPLQLYPFTPERVEACELVDKMSDKLGTVDPAEAVKNYNQYLADNDIRKVMVICDAERASVWYGRISVTNQILLSVGSVLVIVLTLTTSLILGAGWVEKKPSLKPVTVALPLISAAITATISEFHLSDVWQLREIGKIESRLLLEEVYDLSPENTAFNAELKKIKASLSSLERNQAERYFSYKFQRAGAADGVDGPPDGEPEEGDKNEAEAKTKIDPKDEPETKEGVAPAQ